VKLSIAVMGSASAPVGDQEWARLVGLRRAIAERDCVLITGGCPGLPQAAVQGTKAVGGLVVGISPGLSLDEHVHQYGGPTEGFQYVAFIVIILGFLFQWPTLLILVMFPVLVTMYIRLARREERQMVATFGAAYAAYAATTGFFFPRLDDAAKRGDRVA
jgi:hypothetical protein